MVNVLIKTVIKGIIVACTEVNGVMDFIIAEREREVMEERTTPQDIVLRIEINTR